MNRQRRLRVVSDRMMERDERLDEAVALMQHLVEEHPNEDVGTCTVADLCDPEPRDYPDLRLDKSYRVVHN